ncbi:MAG: hypothetical protein ACTSWL_09180 [Promethearchaeota archaeon]
MKRIHTFDFLRAIAVIFLILLHTALYGWLGASDLESGIQESNTGLNIIVFVLTMGSLFHFIMATVLSYTIYKRMERKQNPPKQLILSGLIVGVSLILLHYVYRLFFSPDSGMFYYIFDTGRLSWPIAEWLINSSTLPMLGYTSILISIILVLLLKGDGIKKPKRNYLILGISGTIIVLMTPIVRTLLGPMVETWVQNGETLKAALLAPFVYDDFPIFPLAGYGLIGSTIGIAIARKEPNKNLFLYSGILGTAWVLLGFVGMANGYGIDPALVREYTPQAIYRESFRQFAQLGIFILFFALIYLIMDILPNSRKNNKIKDRKGKMEQANRFNRTIQKFSLLSLTAFMFESMITATMRDLFSLILGSNSWQYSLPNVFLFGFAMILLWVVIANLWSKIKFKGSLEWVINLINQSISKKKSQKFNIIIEELIATAEPIIESS